MHRFAVDVFGPKNKPYGFKNVFNSSLTTPGCTRTQFSLTLITLSVYFGLKKRSSIPLYFITPFLYPFVRIPYLFVVMALHIYNFKKEINIKNTKLALFAPAIFSYVAISILIIIYHKYMIAGTGLEEFLIKTRLPIFSTTGLFCVLLLLLITRYVDKNFKPVLIIIAISPVIAVNTQILTGVVAQPNNYEQNYGTVCLALLITFVIISVKSNNWLKISAGFLAVGLIMIYTKMVFNVNSSPYLRQPIPANVLEGLKIDASKVVVDVTGMASSLNLVLAKQKITGTSISQSFAPVADDYFNNFLCLKMNISKNHNLNLEFKNILSGLDEGYRYLHSNFIYIHLNRKDKFTTFYDPDIVPHFCPDIKLSYYSMKN